MELVDLAAQAVDGTKVIATAAPIQTYDAMRLRELLDRLESAIESLEARNEGGEDGVVAHLPEKLAEQKALRQRVRQAMEDGVSELLQASGAYQSGRQRCQIDENSSGYCSLAQCPGHGVTCRH